MRERAVLFTLKVRWMDGDDMVPLCRISILKDPTGVQGHNGDELSVWVRLLSNVFKAYI